MRIAIKQYTNYIGVRRLDIDEEILDDFKVLEIDDKYSDCTSSDFNNDLTFSVDKYNARKQKENEANYENLIVSKIRKKYSINQELAILRQRDTKPEEFEEYNTYVEQCKAEVKEELL